MLRKPIRNPARATPGLSATTIWSVRLSIRLCIRAESDRVSEGKTLARGVRKPARATPGVREPIKQELSLPEQRRKLYAEPIRRVPSLSHENLDVAPGRC
jgi:hypothetical protein